MVQDGGDITQGPTVLTPTVGASYRNGWRQMWKYFLKLFLIGIIGFVISILSGIFDVADDLKIVLYVLGFIYGFLVVGPIEYGVSFACLEAARSDKLKIGNMFEAFRNYWNSVLANLLVGAIGIVGFILLVIPGIIFLCKLAFIPYLVVDRRMPVIEAVKESWRMTNGHAWTVFFIGLAATLIMVIPISIAVLITFVALTGTASNTLSGIVWLIWFVVGVIPVTIGTMWVNVTFASLYHAVSVSGEV